MDKIWKVKFNGRRRWAIGIFYSCELDFIARNAEHAQDMLFEIRHNPNYEVNNVVSVELVTKNY
jgi:hypothetical protein